MERDDLDILIERRKQEDPEFARTWAPREIMEELVQRRTEASLTQGEVARSIGIPQARVAEMEKNPAGVGFGRILAYASAVGAPLMVTPAKKARKAKQAKRGRGVGSERLVAMPSIGRVG